MPVLQARVQFTPPAIEPLNLVLRVGEFLIDIAGLHMIRQHSGIGDARLKRLNFGFGAVDRVFHSFQLALLVPGEPFLVL